MNTLTAVLIATIVLLVLLFMEMQVYVSFLAASVLFIILDGGRYTWVATTAVNSLSSYAMLAIPLFMVAGTLMEDTGIAAKLVNFCSVLLRNVKGGMGAVIPVTSMLFGTLTGSGTATCAVLSSLLIPRLERLGWNKRYTAALLAASGPLGYMIPPNMNAIMYAVVSNTSVAALFLATVVPGVIWGLGYVALNRIVYTKWWHKPTAQELEEIVARQRAQRSSDAAIRAERADDAELNGTYLGDLRKTAWQAIPAFIMPIIVLGGVYGGIFTATEAGAVGAVYAILVGLFIYKGFTLKDCYNTFRITAKTMGSILIILPMVSVFSRILVLNDVPQTVAIWMGTLNSPIIIMLMIDLIFFISGFFLNPTILIFVLTPLMYPTAMAVGIHPIQLGVILFVGVGIGTVTPPMAIDLFITSKASGVPILDMVEPLLPMIIFICIPVLLLVTFVPALSLWLPNLVMSSF